jgi:hypothetical protein
MKTGFDNIDKLLGELPTTGLVLFGTTFDSIPLSVQTAVNLAENDVKVGYLAAGLNAGPVECLIKSTQANPLVVKQLDSNLVKFGDFKIEQDGSTVNNWRNSLPLKVSVDTGELHLDEILWHGNNDHPSVMIIDWSCRKLADDIEEVKRDISTIRSWAETENSLVILFAPLNLQFLNFPVVVLTEFADIFLACETFDQGLTTTMTVKKYRGDKTSSMVGTTATQPLLSLNLVTKTVELLRYLLEF